MSELTVFRDHCRRMAGKPVAPGCPAAATQRLWLLMADEVDAYLAGETADDGPGLFDTEGEL
jgi:hypothetical protein